MIENTLYRVPAKIAFGYMFKGALIGIFATLVAFAINWSIHYWSAIHTTLTNPEAVMQMKVVTKYEIKK